MDVCMPGMDGLEATRRIRALGSGRAQVPIVALTAQVFEEQINECRSAGMNSHLAKPFAYDTLLEAVSRAAQA
jgi:CheY-like chemotaxis protein